MRTKAVNQIALANKLNLSTATISRSLSGHPDISEETRERVLQEATLLGYRSRKAHTEVVKSPPLLGVFISQSSSSDKTPIERLYLTGMSQAALEKNVILFTHFLSGVGDESLLLSENQPPVLRSGLVSGLALIHSYKHGVVDQLSLQLPSVTLTHHVPTSHADHIDSDHEDGMQILVEHLFQLGHRRLGFIRRLPHDYAATRLCSFIRAHYRHGLLWNPQLEETLPASGSPREEAEALARIVAKSRQEVTAWACDSDGTAYAVYAALKSAGIKIPEEISVVGYDGSDVLANSPQVTTIRVPFLEMGQEAVRQLLARIEQPKLLRRQVILQGQFLQGLTSGPAAKQ